MKKYFYSLLTLLTAVFALSSCEDVPMPYELPIFNGGGDTTIEPAGSGTAEDPFNVEGVIAYIEAGENLDQKVYIKGFVTSVKECSASYGNATFYIATEAGGSNTFYVYRCLGLNGKNVDSDDLIKEGDEVVVYGKVTEYSGTKETVQKEAYIVSINGVGGGSTPAAGEAKGAGTQADPYNPVGANNFTNALADNAKSEANVYIKGKITKIKECSATYGNASFYITENGTTDETDFYVYRCLGLGNKKIDSDTYVKVGDEVIICGKVTKYVSTYGTTLETVQNESYIYSLNGKVEAASGSDDTPTVTPGTASGDGTAASPFNVAAAVKKCKETGETATTDQYYVKGIIEAVTSTGVDTYGNITITMVDTEGATEKFSAFQIYSINSEKFTAATAALLKKGDVIVVKGNLVNYKGNTPETTGKGAGCLVSVNGKTELGSGDSGNTGGDTDSGTTGSTEGVSKSGTKVTLTNSAVTIGRENASCNLSNYGWANASAPTTVTLDDGTTISFAKGKSTNAPKYYDATKGVRMYSKNTITIEGKKPIASVVFECDTYEGTDYVGNPQMTVSFSGNTCVMCNEYTETSGGVQCRIKTIHITYAQ